MSFFKKLTQMLFEESEGEIIVEDELKEVSFSSNKKEKKEASAQAVVTSEVKPQPKVEVEPVVEVQESKLHEAVVEQKKSIRIDLEPKVEAQPQKMKTTRLQPRDEKVEYEFTPVISPMFGSKEEVVTKVKQAKPHTKVKKKQNSGLGLVISPYFGLGEEEEVEEIIVEEEVNQESYDFVEDDGFEREETYTEEVVDDLEEDSLSLDELIEESSEERSEEDLMQISLFGDSTPIKESDN